MNAKAEKLMYSAKMIESDVHFDEQMYTAYEDCFNTYAELHERILGTIEDAERLKLRTIEEEKLKEKEHRTDRMIGIIGVIVGILGFIVGVLGFIF